MVGYADDDTSHLHLQANAEAEAYLKRFKNAAAAPKFVFEGPLQPHTKETEINAWKQLKAAATKTLDLYPTTL